MDARAPRFTPADAAPTELVARVPGGITTDALPASTPVEHGVTG